jgi:RHS repeat-associated protein
VVSLYTSLYEHCQSIQSECGPQNVCDEKLQLLKMDVSPGGQYALYDTNYTLLERPINRLDTAWRNKVNFLDQFGQPDSVMLVTTEGEDSVRKAVRDLSDSLFIAYWKDSWADSLVKMHPEYCHYLWCIVNDSSYAFDKEIDNWQDADTAIARGWFNPNDYKALLDKDPFFKPLANGAGLYQEMKDSLQFFSRTLLHLSQSDKNILQFIDVMLYCNKQADGWSQCNPDSACRSRNREWFLYKQLYLNLKQKFYEEARRTSSDPVFANCINCHIGNDLLQNIIRPCPQLSDFHLVDSLGFKQYIIYNDPENGVSHDVIIYVERKNVSELLPPPGYYLDTVNRTIHKGEWYNSIIYNSNQEDFRIIGMDCLPDTAFTPFTDSSTCNYHCPGGIYNPYDRDSLSFYVEYGNPNTPPSTVPPGYAGCAFYAVFDIKTAASASCRFYNVWVCIYDSTCAEGGVCHAGLSFDSQCPASGTDTLYKNKIRRYAEYVNASDFINNILNGNPQQASSENDQKIIDQCRFNCEAEAEAWINTLRRCTTDSLKLDSLRIAFIDICSKGCSLSNTFGSSSIPSSVTATYHSFEEAIIGILGPEAISDSCTAELLSTPYPFDRQPVFQDRLITETNYDICHKISLRKQEYLASGFSGSFHQWLGEKFGSAYTLDSIELDDLLNSCTNCNGILKNDIVLPLIFDPLSGDCLHCDSVRATLFAFQNKFPGLDSTYPEYETLFSNFFNHHLGFSLTFNQYKNFLDSCPVNGSYTGVLCNEPATIEDTVSTNGCTAELFATALTNATNTYVAYIDSVRKDFRNSWLTKCLNVQPSLKMTADLYEYHYTLYYYDQSGNLVKTIPPEGVHLLTAQDLDTVVLYRKLVNEGCYKYSDSILFNNNGKIAWTVNPFEAQPYTVEMMANLSSHADQVIVSKLAESNLSGSYQHQGFVIDVVNNKLRVGIYGSNLDTAYNSIAVSSLNIGSLLPLNTWTHLAVEQTGNANDPVRIYLNGQAIAFSYTANSLPQAISLTLSGSSPLIVGSHNAPNLTLPGKLRGTLKNLRVYNRLLSPDELRQNAFNACQLASNSSNLLFWSPLNNATNNFVPEQIAKQDGVLTGFTWLAANGKFPDHHLPTTYQYNSLNQVLQQYSPDGDTTQFFYDRLGRLIVSQNKEQKENASYSGSLNRFSYSQYDALGRIKEIGEKSTPSSDIRTIDLLDTNAVKNWIASGIDRQITKTIYDNPINLDYQNISTSRKRVVASIYLEGKNDEEGDSTIYGYDILGNVKTLVQHIKSLVAVDANNGKKRIDYDYGLVSGKVNMVNYQPGKGDQFFYKNIYDADNHVIASYSSRDKLIWTEDASYTYYLHGPLARTELGQYKVQGIDNAYTLQGWLKGINSDSLLAPGEMGRDGWPNTTYSRVSRDVYAFKLGYYSNDYPPIGGAGAGAFGQKNYTAPGSFDNTGNQLFNGNISFITLALSKINSAKTTGYTYGYDQLNRLVEMRQHTTGTASGWSNSNVITAYRESIAYDANGNILKYLRNGTSDTPDMDSLNYKYNRDANGNLVNNQLNHVRDQVSSGNYSVDIDNQSVNNYAYDKIGNLKKDMTEGIDTVRWTVYGKINRVVKGTININYGYDAGGNRTTKKVSGSADTTTFYVRDAQGNVLAIYNKKNSEALRWDEQHLYGSSRLGIWNWDTIVPSTPPIATNNPIYDSLLLGSRTYELANHLGNVLATISDKKIGNDSSSIVNYYLAEVLSQHDYYPFGTLMPERKYDVGVGYRYGFNDKENDNEVKGEGNQQDYGMRIYDPRLGRFLSVDPMKKDYPWYTPYQFAGNRPIIAIDLDGLEPHDVNTHELKANLTPGAAEHKAPTDPIAYGKDIGPWEDLLNFKIPNGLEDQMKKRINGGVQRIQDAIGSNTNFDYYTVQISTLPAGIKNAGELLEKIRLTFDDYMDELTDFAAYNSDERKMWESSNPTGSVMSFDAWFEDPVFGTKWNLDDASVMTSSYYKDDNGGFWTFSTLMTDGDGYHPIAGTRQFGVSTVKGADGINSYLFYIRATDRAYGGIEGILQKTVFSSAETTWKAVCWNIFEWVNNNGGNATIPHTPISKRIPWTEVQDLNKSKK